MTSMEKLLVTTAATSPSPATEQSLPLVLVGTAVMAKRQATHASTNGMAVAGTN